MSHFCQLEVVLFLSVQWFQRSVSCWDCRLFQISRSSLVLRQIMGREDLQDGRAVRYGDDLPPHKHIKNTSRCGRAPREHLLNTDRRPQTSQKARNSPRTWPYGWQVLMPWPGVRPEPLRWESWVPDIGPPETSQPHVISIGKSSPRDDLLNAKTQCQSMTSKLQCCTPHAKQLARQTQPHPLTERLPKIVSSQTPKHTTGRGPAHQKDKIQTYPPEHKHQSPPPGSLHNQLNQPYPLGTDTKNNGNYEPAAWKKETPNTVS